MIDFSKMTDQEIGEVSAGLMAEVQKRSAVQTLEDTIITAVMEAKRLGFSKQQIAQALTRTLNRAFKEDAAVGGGA